MNEIKFINMEAAKNMSETKIRTQIGMYAKHLEEFGMEHEKACEFVSSLLNLGAVMNDMLERKKTNN